MDYIKSFKKYLEAVDNIDDKEAKSKFKDLDDKDIDNDGDVDDSDKYLHHKLGVVNKKADEGHMYGHDDEDSELEEMNVTGNLDGGEGPPKTPYAFGDMDDEDVEKAGYKKVKYHIEITKKILHQHLNKK